MAFESLLLDRYLATNTTQAAFALSAGFTATDPDTAEHRLVTIGVDGDGRRMRGAELIFLGAGAENTTFAYRLYTVHRSRNKIQWELRLFCSGTATLGTGTGVGSDTEDISSTADVFADTLTTTAAGWADAVAAATGSAGPVAHSPADNTVAHLKIDDFGGAYGFIVEFDMTGATSGNAIVELIS